MDKEYTIYAHIFPDKSIYIGHTSQKKMYRRWHYGAGYNSQENVRKAFEFWGWNVVEHVILENKILSKEEALKKECDYTLQYAEKGYKVLNKYNAKNPCRYRVKKQKQEVEYVDLTTGISYKTLREAAEAVKVSHEAIRISILQERPLSNGHCFEKRIKEINIIVEEEKECM